MRYVNAILNCDTVQIYSSVAMSDAFLILNHMPNSFLDPVLCEKNMYCKYNKLINKKKFHSLLCSAIVYLLLNLFVN